MNIKDLKQGEYKILPSSSIKNVKDIANPFKTSDPRDAILNYNKQIESKPPQSKFGDFSKFVEQKPVEEQQKSFVEDIKSSFEKRKEQTSKPLSEAIQGNGNGFTAGIKAGYAAAGFANDTILNILNHTPIVKQVFQGIGKTTEETKDILDAIITKTTGVDTKARQAMDFEQSQAFLQKHPEIESHLKGIQSLAELGLNFTAGGKAKDPLVGSLKSSAEQLGKFSTEAGEHIAKVADESLLKKQWEYLKPELSKVELEARRKANPETFKTSALKGTEMLPTKQEQTMLQYTKDLIDTSKLPTENVQSLREGIKKEATALKESLKNEKSIWNSKLLEGKLNEIEMPITMKSDATQSNIFTNFKKAVMELSKKVNKKPDGLLELRKKFDDLAEKEFGSNLFDKSNPISNMVRDFRNKLNEFTESKIETPEGKQAFRDSKAKQTSMFNAIDNLSSSRKNPKLNQSAIQKATESVRDVFSKHPVLSGIGMIGAGAGASSIISIATNPVALTALLTYGTYKLGKKVITSDAFLRGMSSVLKKSGKVLSDTDKMTINSVLDFFKDRTGLSIKDIGENNPVKGNINGKYFKLLDLADKNGYIYHETSPKFLKSIKKTGLKPNTGISGKGVYFSDNPKISGAQGAPSNEGMLIRTKISYLNDNRLDGFPGEESIYRGSIPPNFLEYSIDNGKTWKELSNK